MPSNESFETSAKAYANRLLRDGYTLLDRVLPEDAAGRLNEEFNRRYANLSLPMAKFDGALETGNRRYMLTVELAGPFGEFSVYANRSVIEILHLVFNRTFVLESFGVVLSLPGARAQHAHRDGAPLFGSELDVILPAWAVTVAIPLIDMNLEQGTTEIFPGSHRWPRWKESSSSVMPDVPAGCGVMWDDRTFHRGTENRSAKSRPLLYLTYGKPWWQDVTNFAPVWGPSGPVRPQSRILFGKGFFDSVPQENRFLFSNVTG
jgi:hypothetical protein